MEDLLKSFIGEINPSIIIASIIIICLVLLSIFKNRKAVSDFINTVYNRRKKERSSLIPSMKTSRQ